MVTPWLPKFERQSSTETQLVCLPYAGGGAALFHRWGKAFPSQLQLVPVNLPGREARFSEPPYESIFELVENLAPIVATEIREPFALLGQSMGALIAFELARQLRRGGNLRPGHLIVMASSAPHLPPKLPLLSDLPDDEFLATLHSRFDGIDPAVLANDELLKIMLPMMRADIRLVENYQPPVEDPLDIPILAMGGNRDTAISLADLQAWRQHTTADFALRTFSGGHFFFKENQDGVMRTIVQRVNRSL